MKLTISGNTPAQKNRKIISVNKATGRPFLRSAPKVKEWQEAAAQELSMQWRGLVVTDYPIAVDIVMWFKDERRRDLDNATSTVMDALVAAGVLEDDDTKHVSQITVQYGGVDKANPRCEIYLED